jgi:hypothetical protein
MSEYLGCCKEFSERFNLKGCCCRECHDKNYGKLTYFTFGNGFYKICCLKRLEYYVAEIFNELPDWDDTK